ncbi:MAG: serine/threonine-protein kinase [Actinomycetia bacterium]|nr:serine/threonine-protein kinase [Actinomycetes bacterium]
MEKIGRYRLTQRIGAGSFATVWRGHDDDLDVPVAVKVLADNWADNDDVRHRFLAEARLLRRISDERIVRVYDIGTLPDGRPYFVMDFANGGSLEQLRKQPAEPGRVLRLCAEAARALEVLHRHRIIHRDVTPGNILLSHSETQGVRVLLADLGVAKNMVDRAGATMTAGTPAYMALEQATGGPLDQRADIYSVAAVTYALLAGRPPFPVKTLPDLLSRNPSIDPAPIADRIGAPPALDSLLFAALSPDPSQRPQTAEIMATALDQLADVMPGGDTYVPRPLLPAEGSELRPAPPMPFGTPSSFISDLHMSPNAPVSLPPSTYTQPRLPAGMETPMSVIHSYLPEAQYNPGTERERHGPLFYAWVALTCLALFLLTMMITLWVTS